MKSPTLRQCAVPRASGITAGDPNAVGPNLVGLVPVGLVPVSLVLVGLTLLGLAIGLTGCGSAPEAKPPSKPQPVEEKPVGELDADKVLYGLRGQPQVRDCLNRAAGGPGLITLSWNVTTSGDADDVQVRRSTLEDDAAERCLVDAVDMLFFGSLDTEARATWTFVKDVPGLERDDEDGESAQGRSKRSGGAQRQAEKRKARKKRDQKKRDGEYDRGISVDPSSPGRLDPDEIESVVKGGFQLYAHCFREGFARDEWLSGVVRLRFQIAPDGTVDQVEDAGSDFDDHETISCIAEGFYALSFPRPPGGRVKAVYPIIFNEHNDETAGRD